jgi:hypothetical protein
MTYTDQAGRAALIAGLRDIAAFLESSPDVPAPRDTAIFVFPQYDAGDRERRAEIDAIASRIFTQAQETSHGHYVTSRFFGPVEYRAISIDREAPGNPEGE